MPDAPPHAGISDPPASRSLRILLADDSRVIQTSVRGLLSRFGHRVDVVNNGLEAIRAVEREEYDAVLMDIRMPEMDGLEATRRLCELRPRSRRPAIIAFTSSSTSQDRERCLATGMDGFLAKPVSGAALNEILTRFSTCVPAAVDREHPVPPPPRLATRPAGSLTPTPCPPPLLPLDTDAAPIQVVVEGRLGDLQVWSDNEWALLPEASRPRTVVHVEGLGWVGVITRVALN